MLHDHQDLIRLFNACFEKEYNTRLVGGASEPLYLPAHGNQSYHAIFFTHDYFRSALHECAHWFIAGEARRQLVDYGYWYEPDGRDAKQQQLFELAEIKPQAIELLLSAAAQHPFSVSIDNLEQPVLDNSQFEQAVHAQALVYQQGLPKRAEQFISCLMAYYR